MDTYRKTRISELESLKNLENEDILIFSRDVDGDNNYDKTHTVKASDLFKAVRSDLKYWSSYEYNPDDLSLNIWSDEDGVFQVSHAGTQVAINTTSPNTAFNVSTGGTELNIDP